MSTMHRSLESAIARLEQYPNVRISSTGSWLECEDSRDGES